MLRVAVAVAVAVALTVTVVLAVLTALAVLMVRVVVPFRLRVSRGGGSGSGRRRGGNRCSGWRSLLRLDRLELPALGLRLPGDGDPAHDRAAQDHRTWVHGGLSHCRQDPASGRWAAR